MRREHLVPVLIGLFMGRSRHARLATSPYARVVDQYVYRPERRDKLREHLGHGCAARHVRDERPRLATRALDLRHDVLRRLGPDIVDADFRALARERQSHLAPKSRAAACYQYYFVLEFHRHPTSCLP